MPVHIRKLGAMRSKKIAINIIDSVFSQYEWQSDMETYGRAEWWLGALEQLKDENIIKDDCDGFSRLVLDLLFFLGGFDLKELAECAVDVDQKDTATFDHHVGAVLIKKEWYYFHCWSPNLLTRRQLEEGIYRLPSEMFADNMKIVQHRKLNETTWVSGKVV